MAIYRYQVVCVGWWRGQIKRWNTTFHSDSSGLASALRTRFNYCCYPNPGDVVGAASGGVASISVYNAAGGPPVQSNVYFDWKTPTTWIPYDGTAWGSLAEQPPIDASGESALVIVGKMAGLSATGKPITTRKYIHAIPSRTALDFAEPDIPTSVAATIAAQFPFQFMGNPAGVVPASVTVDPWYNNHQRVRGRRRTVAQVASNAFTLGVLAGGGATTSGQGEPFPGGEY